MEPKSKNGDARFLPVGDRYDGVNMTTLDGVLARFLAQNDGIAMVDTGAGRLGNFWQMAFLCNTLLVPTSMSWVDLRPTIDFIKEIDDERPIYGRSRRMLLLFPIESRRNSVISSRSSTHCRK